MSGASMNTVNIHQAKTHFSRLVDQAAAGDSIVIAKAGRPVAKLVPLGAMPPEQKKRTGFLRSIEFPDDFDRMAEAEIAASFSGIE